MLEGAIKSPMSIGNIHISARQRLCDTTENLMDKIKRDNSHKKMYWIHLTVSSKRKKGRTTISPIVKAYYVQPDVKKESMLFQVDNTAGTCDCIWSYHPNNQLRLPTLGKSISVAN